MRTLNKVVVWGHPLHSHTHSYVHYAWVKTFKHLGYDTFWFHADDYPVEGFDFTNALFITECSSGADRNIPLHASNVYFVHACTDPHKYISSGARLIDIRYHVKYLFDTVYNYNLDEKIAKGEVQTLRATKSLTYYEQRATNLGLNPRFRTNGFHQPYEAIYMFWATDLLPHEFNFDNRFIEPMQPHTVTFVGSIGMGNQREVHNFLQGCCSRGIKVQHIDPWRNPVSFDENMRLVQESVIAPDVRGDGDPNSPHKTIGYIPCRLFKHISYGKLGATNCERIYELFKPFVLYHNDETQLVDLCLQKRNDFEFIKKQMEWVAKYHTYINRVDDIIAVLFTDGSTICRVDGV